jgi:hypothetical protein
LPDTGRLTSGRYRPTNHRDDTDPFPHPGRRTRNVALATFRGINPNGDWKLFITDDWTLDTGRIAAGWALRIRALVRV